jgi:hypothetical protein
MLPKIFTSVLYLSIQPFLQKNICNRGLIWVQRSQIMQNKNSRIKVKITKNTPLQSKMYYKKLHNIWSTVKNGCFFILFVIMYNFLFQLIGKFFFAVCSWNILNVVSREAIINRKLDMRVERWWIGVQIKDTRQLPGRHNLFQGQQ